MAHPCVVQEAGDLGAAKQLEDLGRGADSHAEVIEQHPLRVAATADVGWRGGCARQAGPRACPVRPS